MTYDVTELRLAAGRRTTALRRYEEAHAALREEIALAAEAGIPPTSLVAMTGLSRQAIYEITRKETPR